MKKLLNVINIKKKSNERQYIASMETKDGNDFVITVTAVSTREALIKIDSHTSDGCFITDLKIIDRNGNII